MTTVTDPAPESIRTDYDTSATESVKLERNSRGFNWSIRVVREEGETWEALLRRLAGINHVLDVQYGRG